MNYYNEHDPKAAAWLRVLIEEKLIPKGDVDERDIQNVSANDLAGFTQCHFFAGIGGWSLALRFAGWPDDKPVWTGSCPCQPFSDAGQGMGVADERHLWPDFRNLIGKRRPPVVFGEQVASKLGRGWLAGVRLDLENAGYAVGASDLCAAGLAAPHKRQRFFWVANSILRGCAARSYAESRQKGGRAFIDKPSFVDGLAVNEGKGRSGMESEFSKEQQQRTRVGSDCPTDAVADAKHAERRPLDEHRENGLHRQDAGRQKTHRQLGTCGEICGSEDNALVQPNSAGRDAGRTAGEAAGHGGTIEPAGSLAVALGDSKCAGLEGHSRNGHNGHQPGRDGEEPSGSVAAAGPWSDYRIIETSDGKARRIPVEPAFFPLAHGFPARVAVLKGFGNAIVPEVAAEFIKAVML